MVESQDNNSLWKPVNLSKILQNKNLSAEIFESKHAPTLDSDIAEHAVWAFTHIYSVAYPNAQRIPVAIGTNIARYVHGIQHVSRVALFVLVFANLFRKHGDPEAMQLSEADIKLLQIAALFHDSAREDEGEDKWDHESAIFLYFYLTQVLDVACEKAKLIAEATANKDANAPGRYFEIAEDEFGMVTCRFKTLPLNAKKNIYQKLIQVGDCLDILRARPAFDAKYLDFYKDIVGHGQNNLAMEEMAHLMHCQMKKANNKRKAVAGSCQHC